MDNVNCDFFLQDTKQATNSAARRHWQISTPRMLLRSWQESDRELFAAICADPQVMEFFPAALSRAESNAMINRIMEGFDERGWGLWAVDVKPSSRNAQDRVTSTDQQSAKFGAGISTHSSGRSPEAVSGFIGFVGLAVPRFEAHFTPCVEVGWRLRQSAWGYGFATEAAAAAIHFGFTQLNLDQIASITSTLNIRSQRVMQRLGMECNPDDNFDHPLIDPNHRLCRHVLYRLNNPATVTRTAE